MERALRAGKHECQGGELHYLCDEGLRAGRGSEDRGAVESLDFNLFELAIHIGCQAMTWKL